MTSGPKADSFEFDGRLELLWLQAVERDPGAEAQQETLVWGLRPRPSALSPVRCVPAQYSYHMCVADRHSRILRHG